jgi:hypothetical protein
MIRIYSQFGHAIIEWYSNWSEDIEYTTITVNHNCQPYLIEYNQFEMRY